MSALPFEILTSIFKLLRTYHLEQCQLVCRSWNQASSKILYSDVDLTTEEQCKLYLRTIKSAPHLGKYLKVIEAGVCYENEEDPSSEIKFNNWDRHDILNTVIELCPNVSKILNDEPSKGFWETLMKAASLDRLSRLKYVTDPENENFYHYASTALAFKETLITLELPDKAPEDFFEAEVYPILRQNLNQFPRLQTLKINCYCKQYLSYYDTVIDHCKELTNLILDPEYYYDELIPTNPTKTIQPHLKIETFECSWPIVNTENQIAYIKQKFPNLKSLVIRNVNSGRDTVNRIAINNLLKLLTFIISLKKGSVSVTLNPEDWVNPYVSIISEKISAIDVTISIFVSRYSNSRSVFTHFTRKSLSLSFRSYTNQHIELLSKIGKKIRSLDLRLDMLPPNDVTNVDQVIGLIKLCPSLQHLEFSYLQKFLYPDSIDYQHFELKSLTLETYDHTIGSLKKISYIFPNLKKLDLFVSREYGITKTITIDMPYTSFDILRCSIFDDFFFELGSIKIYIRLKSDAGLQFFLATKDEVQQVNEDKHKQLHFDIICRSLAKIRMIPVGPYLRHN